MRNVAEHIDEYSLGKGRDPSVVKEMLEASTLDPDGPTLRWLETELDASQALAAGEALFRAIQEAGSGFPSA